MCWCYESQKMSFYLQKLRNRIFKSYIVSYYHLDKRATQVLKVRDTISAIFFTEISPPPVRWVAVAHPLLMRRRATRAWASCSPDLERALSF